jgi:hypothetical protein
MDTRLESGDRLILIVAGMLLTGLVLASFIFYPSSARSSPSFPSTYSASGGGCKAAYLLLERLGFPVKRWTNPPQELPDPGKGTRIVLILADPLIPPSTEEQAAIHSFAWRGGRVLATGAMGAAVLGGRTSFAAESTGTWRQFRAEAPAPVTRRAPAITLESSFRWPLLWPGHVRYYGDENGAVVIGYKIGRGEVVWWASASPLTNYGLSQASNIMLFLNSTGLSPQRRIADQPHRVPSAQPKNALVLWDEYFHGQQKTLWAYLGATPLPWALLQLAVLAASAWVAYGRRCGPLRPLTSSGIRFSPLEFVDALAGLYRRKGDACGILQLVYPRFRSLVAAHLRLPAPTTPDGLVSVQADAGLKAGATNEDLVSAMRQKLGEEDSSLGRLLERCEDGMRAAKLTEPEALQLVQRLHDAATRIGLLAPNARASSPR